jgi:subtilisin
VTATLTGARAEGARVWVGGEEAEVVRASGNTLVFRVPAVAGGPKEVEVQTSRGTATATLGVLGQVARDRVLLRLPPGQALRDLPQGFSLIRRDDLRGCGFALAELGYAGKALGRALEELEALDPSYKADPESLWSFDSWGAEAIGAFQAHRRGLSGQGVAVAVLDTGVDPVVPQLPGYDFVEDDTVPQDAFPGGHGTGAAGLVKEVAPDADILPVRVCDQSGVCRASRVVRGVCWVVQNRQGPTVLNLSLGGDTPVEALKLALEAALSQGIPVAAAAGNQGNQGSPAHYPAAFDLPGLVAVAALDRNLSPASYSTRGGLCGPGGPGHRPGVRDPGGWAGPMHRHLLRHPPGGWGYGPVAFGPAEPHPGPAPAAPGGERPAPALPPAGGGEGDAGPLPEALRPCLPRPPGALPGGFLCSLRRSSPVQAPLRRSALPLASRPA